MNRILTRIASSDADFNNFLNGLNLKELDKHIFNTWNNKNNINKFIGEFIKSKMLLTDKDVKFALNDLSIEYIKAYLIRNPISIDVNELEKALNICINIDINVLLKNYVSGQNLFYNCLNNYIVYRSTVPRQIYSNILENKNMYINNFYHTIMDFI